MSPQLAESVTKLPKMELVPPRGADVEGIFRQSGSPHNGRIIYTVVEVDPVATKATKAIKLDAAGNEVWKRHPTTGEPLYPMLKKTVTYRTRRFVLYGQEVGRHVKMVEHFEPTAEELAALAQKDAERDFFAEFVREAAKSGLSAAQIVQKIKADTLADGESAEAVELDVTEDAIADVLADMGSGEMLERTDDEDSFVSVSEEPEPEQRRKRGRPRKGE